MFGSAYAGVRVLVLGPGNIGDKCQIIQWSYGRMAYGLVVWPMAWAYERTDISHYIQYYFSSIATLLFRLAKMHVSTHVCWYPISSTPSFILKYYKNKQNISRRQTEEIDPVYDGQ